MASAKPAPPAAPVPGRSANPGIPAAASTSPARWRRPASSAVAWARSAPFCEAKTWAAPCGPCSGLRTSTATSIEVARRRASTEERSTAATKRSAPPPRPIGRPPRIEEAGAPSAIRMPAPPSVEALPPTPTMTRRAPPASAAAMSSPVPRLVARIGSRRDPIRRRPEASAISTTATSGPIQPSRASRGRPVGPVTRTR